MGYITENLVPGERVVHQSRLHWIVFLAPTLLLALGVLMFTRGQEVLGAALLLLLLAAITAFGSAIQLQTSEFGVTNRRVLIKTGLISRRSLDITLGKVESVEVEQGILGRLLDYGTIVVIGSGTTRGRFKNIADPMAFRLHVNDQIEQRTRADSPAVMTAGRGERECPYCAEVIMAKAKFCKHCGREVASITA